MSWGDVIMDSTHDPAHARNVIVFVTKHPRLNAPLLGGFGTPIKSLPDTPQEIRVQGVHPVELGETRGEGLQVSNARQPGGSIRRRALKLSKAPRQTVEATFSDGLDALRSSGKRRGAHRNSDAMPAGTSGRAPIRVKQAILRCRAEQLPRPLNLPALNSTVEGDGLGSPNALPLLYR